MTVPDNSQSRTTPPTKVESRAGMSFLVSFRKARMMRSRGRPNPYCILSCGFVLGACDAAEHRPSVVRTDSAAVKIVESSEAVWVGMGQQQLSREPVLHIGTVDGPEAEQFTRITSTFWLSDGRIVAANFESPPEIRVFSADGQHEVSMGGSGEGPGEFRAISMAARLPGDTLLVHDYWNARLTYLDPGGELLGTRALIDIVGEPSTRWVIRDVFEDGTLLAFENSLYPGATPGHRRARRSLVRVAPTGELVDTLLVIPDGEYVQARDWPTGVLFGLRSAWHLDGGHMYVAPGDEFRLDVYDTEGTLQRSLRRQYTRPPVRSEHIEAERERRLARVATEDARRQVEEALRGLQIAEHLPATGQRILTDSEGRVWVKHYEVPGATLRQWSVFAQDGGFLGEVEVPSNFRVMEVREGRVLGVWVDELDVPALRIYELEPGGK